MIPLHDDVPSRTTPFVNYAIIATCTAVFLAQVNHWPDLPERLGMIPALVSGARLGEAPGDQWVHPWLTPLLCTFLHGGWLHFLGNMWFLWIFGDNVEDCLGHRRFLVFYLVAGVAASLAHYASDPGSTIPSIGASGAIAAVMGAYMMLYPGARVLTLVPFFVVFMVTVPAGLFLAVWFAIQFTSVLQTTPGYGGVAWWAHIGGFAVGLAVVAWLRASGRLRAQVQVQRRRYERRRIDPFRRRR